jgi:TPP-dependent pyruvate/acetoin dehydrogenase alpha subunit
MLTIRLFEETLFSLYNKGHLSGTVHTYIGQEAIAVGVLSQISPDDIIFSNHRCHGHFLAKNNDVKGLFAEIMGKEGAICKGRGGSQHIYSDNFYSNGVQGNMFPVAAGISLSQKIKKTGGIGIIFIGDGTFGEGILYETLNIISLWEIPLLIIVENNLYAQSTPIEKNFSGSFKNRALAFNIDFSQMESNDVKEIYNKFTESLHFVRKNQKPRIEVVNTYRLAPHSKGDDDRSKDEIDMWKLKDPLTIIEKELTQEIINNIKTKTKLRISNIIDDLLSKPNINNI